MQVLEKIKHSKIETGECDTINCRQTPTIGHDMYRNEFVHKIHKKEVELPRQWFNSNRRLNKGRIKSRPIIIKYLINPTLKESSIEERFTILAKNWKRETAIFSTVAPKITNQNYLAIIGLGVTKYLLKNK